MALPGTPSASQWSLLPEEAAGTPEWVEKSASRAALDESPGRPKETRPMTSPDAKPAAKTPARTLVTVATYNERENLPLLVEEIFRYAPNVDLLVIDDNSPDGTGAWCDQAAASNPRLRCLHRAGKLGLGTAIVAGMKYAIEHGYEYVLNMDADFSHHPRYLPAILEAMEKEPSADVAIGSRYVAGGGVEGWPLKRQLMSRAVNLYARWLLWLSARDCSGAYRCYRTSLLKKIDLDAVRSRGYSFQEEILWRARRAGARMREVPIVFADRTRGASKIDSREAREALWVIFRLGVFGR
jgi:dolichol-phosphate mannosyltransferase